MFRDDDFYPIPGLKFAPRLSASLNFYPAVTIFLYSTLFGGNQSTYLPFLCTKVYKKLSGLWWCYWNLEIFMYKIIIMMFQNELSELTLAWCFQLHEFWRVEVGCQGGTSSMRGTLIFNRIANLFIWIWSITRNWSSRSFKFSSLSFCNCRSKFSISLSVKDMLIVHQRHEHRTHTTTLRHSWATAVKEAPNSVPPTSQLSQEFAVMP